MEKTPEQLLVDYLGYDSPEDICVENYNIFSDDDAYNACKDIIRENLWSFNPAFLTKHMGGLIGPDDANQIANRMYEDASPVFLEMIQDFDAFVDDAIKSDGRGHFLASYDGVEMNLGTIDGIDYYAYKVA